MIRYYYIPGDMGRFLPGAGGNVYWFAVTQHRPVDPEQRWILNHELGSASKAAVTVGQTAML